MFMYFLFKKKKEKEKEKRRRKKKEEWQQSPGFWPTLTKMMFDMHTS